MRISDWSSDVCSSDLAPAELCTSAEGNRYMQHGPVGASQDDSGVTKRVREHPRRLRAQGLRPVQIWVPDVRSPEFEAPPRRQSAAVAASGPAADRTEGPRGGQAWFSKYKSR